MEQGEREGKRTYIKTQEIDMADLEKKLKSSDTSRMNIDQIIRVMLNDSTTASIIKSIMEDATTAFDDGRLMKAVSAEPITQNYADKQLENFGAFDRIKEQTLRMIVYGELYAVMFTLESFLRKMTFFNQPPTDEQRNAQPRKKIMQTSGIGDGSVPESQLKRLIHKLETVNNPLEYYDVSYLGESVRFYRRPIAQAEGLFSEAYELSSRDLFKYSSDILIHKMLYPAIIKERGNSGKFDQDGEPVILTVERGRGMLEDAWHAFVDLKLTEAAVTMTREAKATVVTIIKLYCGEMTDEEADEASDALLERISIKRSVGDGKVTPAGITEYTNSVVPPATVVTTIRGERTGDITSEQVGGDYNPGDLTDLKHKEDVFFGAFRVMKQKFGRTDGAAGFDAGEALGVLQDEYAKMIDTLQSSVCSLWEDIVNRYINSNGLVKHAGKFKYVMPKMFTQAQSAKEETRERGIQSAEQLMNAVDGKEDNVNALKMLRVGINRIDMTNDVVELLDEMIKKAEQGALSTNDNADGEMGGILNDLTDGDTGNEEIETELPDFNEVMNNIESDENTPDTAQGE